MGSDLGKLCGAEGIRTPDPLHAMEVRYQLRYSPARPWTDEPGHEGQTFEDRTSTVKRSYPAAAATSTLPLSTQSFAQRIPFTWLFLVALTRRHAPRSG